VAADAGDRNRQPRPRPPRFIGRQLKSRRPVGVAGF
jgi:hypothetical protein